MILLREEKFLLQDKAVVRMAKIKVTQIKSTIGRHNKQKKILIGLGLNKINRSKIIQNNPAIQGMVEKVKHLLKIEQVKDET